MDQKILFTLILSSGLATTTYGLTSKANIHIFMQHMLKNSGDVATPDKKSIDHPDFRGSWKGVCQHKGMPPIFGPDTTYNSKLDISISGHLIKLQAEADSEYTQQDNFSREFVLGGVELTNLSYLSPSRIHIQQTAYVYTSKEFTYWTANGQKLIFNQIWSVHNLKDLSGNKGVNFDPGRDLTDETSLEIVDGKLVYNSVANWYVEPTVTTCTYTQSEAYTSS